VQAPDTNSWGRAMSLGQPWSAALQDLSSFVYP